LSGAVTVRPFALRDLDAAVRFCDATRALDPAVEPFGQRLGLIATGPRAALELWRVAAGEDGGLYGLAFAAVRAAGREPVCDFYAAVHPSMRRQALGRALSEAALASSARLRARVRDDASAGRAFLRALGFSETGAQLSLQWSATKIDKRPMPALRIRAATPRDEETLKTLSNDAWEGAPDTFASRADEIAQVLAEQGRVVLLAQSEGQLVGYLSAVQLGRTLGIEEVAVLPQFRRIGVARALTVHALSNGEGAVLSVSESNRPARALYRSLGFRQTARRLLMERRHGHG
jgi:ribosomal protein S18 acetylase RimI-like enzyme